MYRRVKIVPDMHISSERMNCRSLAKFVSLGTVLQVRTSVSLLSVVLACIAPAARAAPLDVPGVIAAIKPSIVAVGIFRPTDSPRFTFIGSGFVVRDGRTVVTNVHVVRLPPEVSDSALSIAIRTGPNELETRPARLDRIDPAHDLAVLRFDGPPLPGLTLHAGDDSREGDAVLLTGFPVGGALSFAPVTHRGMISSITPVAMPGATSSVLDARLVNRLREGTFDIFQLDATAYPGNSGGPLVDPGTGEVVGVVNMGLLKGLRESAISQPSGISYAIPVKFLRTLLDGPR